jgi:hypothetical protein
MSLIKEASVNLNALRGRRKAILYIGEDTRINRGEASLSDALAARQRPVNLKILATDVHKASLEVASAGTSPSRPAWPRSTRSTRPATASSSFTTRRGHCRRPSS